MINAEFVEKALLGAILNEPTRREDVSWLEVDDFTNPLCRALWQHLQTGAESDLAPPVDFVTLSDVLRRTSDLHPRLTAPSQIAELQIQAPTRPDPVAYGQIIVEVSIRNKLIALGLKVGTAAEQNPQPDHAQLSASMRAIGDLGRRWERIHPPPSASSVDEYAGSRMLPGTRRVDREDSGPPAGESRALAIAEMAVVKAAVHDSPKGARSLLLARLRPSDFDQPKIAATFHAVEILASIGGHVDEVTVAWELQRGIKEQGPGLDITELRGGALVSQLRPVDIQTITNASMQRSVLIAATGLVKAADDLHTDLPPASERACRSLREVAALYLRQI
jgi:replicative DNA helicase